jgi:hypothetical protein
MRKALQKKLQPAWKEVEAMGTDTEAFLGSLGCSQDVINAVSMVCRELVENAVKYGHHGQQDEASISVSVEVGDTAITVEVKNPLGDASEESMLRLDRTIQWIRGHQSAFEAYTEMLRRVSAQEEGESRLGLVRVAYEGQSVLDFYVDERSSLAVSAIYRF